MNHPFIKNMQGDKTLYRVPGFFANKLRSLLIVLIFISSQNGVSFCQGLYKNPGQPVSIRVPDLMSRMNLEEKVDQLSMLRLKDLPRDADNSISGESLSSFFQGPSVGCQESPFIGNEDIAVLSEAADSYLWGRIRLGIPAIQIAECLHGFMSQGATIFPQTVEKK